MKCEYTFLDRSPQARTAAVARGPGRAALQVALTLAAAGLPAARAVDYQITELGTLGAPFSAAFALNNLGQVGGVAADSSSNLHGVVLDAALVEVPPLAGDSQSHVFAITDNERIIAYSYDLGEMDVRGLYLENGLTTGLPGLAPRGANSVGVIVGHTRINDATLGWIEHAARWQNGALSDLGTLGGNYSYAYDVSEPGWIVGVSSLPGELTRHAAMWINGAIRDLGTLGGTSSQAYAINESGEIVGWAQTANGEPHAFLFTTDAGGNVVTRTDLGSIHGYSYAYGINSVAQVVGTSASRAVLWDAGMLIDLNARIPAHSGWRLDAAWAINDSGEIAGMGALKGLPRGFLLTPAQTLPGDLNCDGVVTVSDIGPFVLALTNPASYATQFPNCNILTGDMNGDGQVTVGDIGLFVQAVTSGG